MNDVIIPSQRSLRFYRALSSLLGLVVLLLAPVACRDSQDGRTDRTMILDRLASPEEEVGGDREMITESEPLEVRANRIVLLDDKGNPGIILVVGGEGRQTALVIQDGSGREVMRLGAPSIRPLGGTG
jgi:hypothetical protein